MSKNVATVKVVPATGRSTNKSVEIKPSGVSLQTFLQEAGLSHNGMNLTVNGEPANLRTHVDPGDEVTLTEKARGS